PPLDNLQGGCLLADEQDGLAGGEELGDGVGDGLALARAGRSIDDQAGPADGRDEGRVLAAVGVEDVPGADRPGPVVQLVGGGQVAREGQPHSNAGDGPAEVVPGDEPLVAAQVFPHGQFLEAEDAQGDLVEDFPARVVADAPLYLAE